MRINGALRFLIFASALLLWVGAVATAGEQSEAEEAQTPPVEAAAPPASSDEDVAVAEQGGEAPEQEPDQGSEE
jgi:hypothetical protein